MSRNPYAAIGVEPFINCAGVRTVHGGSLMPTEVLEAMQLAGRSFVNIDELMAGAGRRVAELTGAEAAIVTSGCAAALCHATAAALTGADPEMMLRLPATEGLKARVIMPASARFTYDHAIRMVGAQVVEVRTRTDLKPAIDAGVAMIALLGSVEAASELSLDSVAPIAREHGVPILVDAAAELPDLPNRYLSRGATMVAYSGGKYLRGPQAAGLLLGEERWIRAAWLHSAPHHTFGRPMKVGKEEIMGMLAALEVWAANRESRSVEAKCRADLATIAKTVSAHKGVHTRILEPGNPVDCIPRLEISWRAEELRVEGDAVRGELLRGKPRIMLDDRGSSPTSLVILPFSLQPGEAEVVGRRMVEALTVLSNEPERREQAASDPGVDLNGLWDVDLRFLLGTARHQLSISMQDGRIAGHHRTLHLQNPISGFAAGGRVELSSLHKFEGTNLSYRFFGTIEKDGRSMSGTVEMGSTGLSAPGPLNMKEYGLAEWRATRRCPRSGGR